jgi:hypothetical protein
MLFHAPVGETLADNEIPGDDRHEQQHDEQKMREAVGLHDEVRKAQLGGGVGVHV